MTLALATDVASLTTRLVTSDEDGKLGGGSTVSVGHADRL